MGTYLSKPEKEIEVTQGKNDKYAYCVCEMQGWRISQEDANTVLLNFDDYGTSYFAVFDGHGGEEVAKYCSIYLHNTIRSHPLYKENKIKEALEQTFLSFDQTLTDPKVVNQLKQLVTDHVQTAEDIDANEANDLRKDAEIPLDQLLSKQENVSSSTNEGEGSSSTSAPSGSSSSSSKEQGNGEPLASQTSENGEISSSSAIPAECSTSENTGDPGKSESSSKKEKQSLPGLSKSNLLSMLFQEDFDDEDDEEEEDDDEEELEEEEASSSEDEIADLDDEEDSDLDDDDDDFDADALYQNSSLQKIASNMFSNSSGSGCGVESGCTANVALIRDDTLYVANIGDSRCVLSRLGQAIELSVDHKPEDDEEKLRIEKAGGKVSVDGRVNNGLNLSRAFGDHAYKVNKELSDKEQMITAWPDVKVHQLDRSQDEFMILACDGIWNSMTSQEAVNFVGERLKQNLDLKSIVEELFHNCLAPNTQGDGSGCDNMTCIVVVFKKPNEESDSELTSISQKRPLEDGEPSSTSNGHSSGSNGNGELSHADEPSESSNKKPKIEDNSNQNNEVGDVEDQDLSKPGPSR